MVLDNRLLLLDKPVGISSCRAVAQIKRILGVKKAGHAGTLDPCAEGLLIIALGIATRALAELSAQNKCYEVYARLGLRTATGDREGEVIERSDFVVPQAARLTRVLATFVGETEQTPPMYSALKYRGQRLYRLARANRSVPRKKRKIYIEELTLKEIGDDGFAFSVRCSKGTYVRTLVEDLAKALGTIAYTQSLRRTAIGAFSIESAVALDYLTNNPERAADYLIDIDALYSDYQAYVMDYEAVQCFNHGRYAALTLPSEGCFRLYNTAGDFLGLSGDGKVRARFV